MYINSPGGQVTSALAIYDTMQYIKSPVSTVVMGMAASAGSLILTAGEAGQRIALPNARVMVHQPSGGFRGQASDIERHAEDIRYTKRRLNEIYVHHTGRTYEEVERTLDRDHFMTPRKPRPGASSTTSMTSASRPKRTASRPSDPTHRTEGRAVTARPFLLCYQAAMQHTRDQRRRRGRRRKLRLGNPSPAPAQGRRQLGRHRHRPEAARTSSARRSSSSPCRCAPTADPTWRSSGSTRCRDATPLSSAIEAGWDPTSRGKADGLRRGRRRALRRATGVP